MSRKKKGTVIIVGTRKEDIQSLKNFLEENNKKATAFLLFGKAVSDNVIMDINANLDLEGWKLNGLEVPATITKRMRNRLTGQVIKMVRKYNKKINNKVVSGVAMPQALLPLFNQFFLSNQLGGDQNIITI